ncbi:MAG TPA: hypothetical protein VEP90_25820 [Methylomirabilota bacterium]|nr:hypothetical protein [Methylomirabilota bacterium]
MDTQEQTLKEFNDKRLKDIFDEMELSPKLEEEILTDEELKEMGIEREKDEHVVM